MFKFNFMMILLGFAVATQSVDAASPPVAEKLMFMGNTLNASSDPIIFGDKVYYEANAGAGNLLYKVDRKGNVSRIGEVNAAGTGQAIVFNGKLCMGGTDSVTGKNELVIIEKNGTVSIVDVNGAGVATSSNVGNFGIWGDELYFVAVKNDLFERALYKLDSDGIVTEVTEVPSPSFNNITDLAEINDALYMQYEGELLRLNSDGTTDLFDLNGVALTSNPRNITAYDEKLYMRANTALGTSELLVFNTQDDTFAFINVNGVVDSSFPARFFEYKGNLWFAVYLDASFGNRELAKIEGDGSITKIDLNPGPDSSFPGIIGQFTTWQGKALIEANLGGGTKMYKMDSNGNLDLIDQIPGEPTGVNGSRNELLKPHYFMEFGGEVYKLFAPKAFK